MTTVADVDLSTWNRYPSSPRLRGSDPFGSNLISVGQAVESDLAQSIAGGDVVAAYAPSADSRLIYVSATGNDGTGASTTIAAQTDAFDPQGTVLPYLTVAAAFAQIRDGYPDWILFKRGDSWTDQYITLAKDFNGRSSTEPFMLTYYGATGDRPLFRLDDQSGVLAQKENISNVTIYGLEYYAYKRDPASPDYLVTSASPSAIKWLGGGSDITIEECKMSFFGNNILMQSYVTTLTNVTIRRCIVTDSWRAAEAHSQGIYADQVTGLLIEDCLFDHNGWNESIVPEAHATLYNHNIYLQYGQPNTDVIVRNNILTRGSSHGVHGRPGGSYDNNLIVENSVSLGIGYAGQPLPSGSVTTVTNNVILDGKLMNPNSGTYTDDTTAVWGLIVDDDALNNSASLTLENNIIAHRRDTGSNDSIKLSGATDTNNIIHLWDASDTTNPGWTDPTLKVGDFMNNKSLTATTVAFIDYHKDRALNSWDTTMDATSVNDYIRVGFDR